MKKYFLLSLIISCTFFACSTDFDITSEWKEIPVVYGLMTRSETTHYFKINKAFLGDADALEMASVADSLYFPEDMEVKLAAYRIERNNNGDIEYDNNGNYTLFNNPKATFNLQRVNGADEDLDKEEGIFQDNPFYVYKFDQFDIEGDGIGEGDGDKLAYKLEFTTPTGNEVSAITTIINDFKVLLPSPDGDFSLVLDNSNDSWLIKWRSSDFAEIFDVSFRVNYQEAPINDYDNRTNHSIVWTPIRNFNAQVASASSSSNNYEKTINKVDLFNFIAGRLGQTTDNYRFLTSIDLIFDAATKEYNDYITINSSSNGLTANQVKAEYTNVEGGIGIFSSRYQKIVSYTSFLGLQDFACNYPETAGLNFAPALFNNGGNWPDCP